MSTKFYYGAHVAPTFVSVTDLPWRQSRQDHEVMSLLREMGTVEVSLRALDTALSNPDTEHGTFAVGIDVNGERVFAVRIVP